MKVLSILFSSAFYLFWYKHWITKALPIVGMAKRLRQNHIGNPVAYDMSWGFIFSAIGDVALYYHDFLHDEEKKKKLFLGGLFSFLIAHLVYGRAFIEIAGERNQYLLLIPMAVIYAHLMTDILPKVPTELFYHVLCYGLVISMMGYAALNRVYQEYFGGEIIRIPWYIVVEVDDEGNEVEVQESEQKEENSDVDIDTANKDNKTKGDKDTDKEAEEDKDDKDEIQPTTTRINPWTGEDDVVVDMDRLSPEVKKKQAWRGLYGAVLFLMSDTFLAFNMFCPISHPFIHKHNVILVMSTYYLGQLFICISVD